MTVNVSKPVSNLREQLSELNRPVGSHGSQLMKSANTAESFSLVRAGRKNLIINGSCMIDQRNGGAAVSSGYAVDRTHIEGFNGAGTGTGQQVSDAPEGLFKSLKITVTGTDTSLGSTDFYTLRHIIEGQNVAHLGFGTNNAKTVTLSFWVKSSITGIFCCSLGNGTNNKTMPREYHIDNPNKWEYKTLTFDPAITGSWGTDHGRGFSVRWCMGVGSTRRGDADVYNGNESHGTINQTNLFATNGATFQITGMQLETGSSATPFEYRSYGEELALCKRYYEKYTASGGNTGRGPQVGSYNNTRYFGYINCVAKRHHNVSVGYGGGLKVEAINLGSDAAVTDISDYAQIDGGNGIFLEVNTSSWGSGGTLYHLGFPTGGYISIDSEM